jgi:hypothetical protein
MIEILLILAVIGVVTMAYWYFHMRKTGIAKRVSKIERRSKAGSGLGIWLEDGVSYPVVSQIEAAMLEMFEKAGEKGYQTNLTLDKYTIAVLNPDGYRDGIPVLKTPVGDYSGTVYDQGGFVFAGGQFLPPFTIAIPSYEDAEGIKDIIAHEMIHAILYHNDRVRYEATKTHQGGFEL